MHSVDGFYGGVQQQNQIVLLNQLPCDTPPHLNQVCCTESNLIFCHMRFCVFCEFEESFLLLLLFVGCALVLFSLAQMQKVFLGCVSIVSLPFSEWMGLVLTLAMAVGFVRFRMFCTFFVGFFLVCFVLRCTPVLFVDAWMCGVVTSHELIFWT